MIRGMKVEFHIQIIRTACFKSQCTTKKTINNESIGGAWYILTLNKTIVIKIQYKKTGEPVTCYVDADWGGDN